MASAAAGADEMIAAAARMVLMFFLIVMGVLPFLLFVLLVIRCFTSCLLSIKYQFSSVRLKIKKV
jgi:glucan phosphoethanolaminetransferase (alkaline phosphatase superfamily)